MKKLYLSHQTTLRSWLVCMAFFLGVSVMQAQTAYVANGNDGNVSVIDVTSGMVIQTISTGINPFAVAISPDNSEVYVAHRSHVVVVIDANTNTATDTIALSSGDQPVGIAITPDGSELYVANASGNTVKVINTATKQVTDTIAAGIFPFGIAVTPDGSEVFVSNGNTGNEVRVINTTTKMVTDTITVGNDPRGVVISPDGATAYVATNSGTVSFIDVATKTVTSTINVVNGAFGITINFDGSEICVANTFGSTASFINTATQMVSSVSVGTNPRAISYTPDGSQVYVANLFSDDVSVIDAATKTVVNTIAVGDEPISMGNFITGNVPATALNFDGIDDRVKMQGLDLTGALTIEAWIKPEPKFDFSTIIANKFGGFEEPGFIFSINDFQDSSRVLVFESRNNKVISATPVVWDVWQHIAFTYDGGTDVHFYLDGVDLPLSSTGIDLDSSNFETYIGDLSVYFMNAHYKGDMDELRIWDNARTQSQILNNMDCELTGMEAGLAAYYNFNEGLAAANNPNDTVLIDLVFNGNDGVLEDFALSGPTSNWIFADTLGGCPEEVDASALSFAQDDDYIIGAENSTYPAGASARSISGWVKIPAMNTSLWGSPILSYGSTGATGEAFAFGVHKDGKLYFWGHNIDLFGSADVNDDMWHQISATFNGSELTFYLDGEVDTVHTIAAGTLNTVSNGDFTMGTRILNGSIDTNWTFPGLMDEVSLWNRSLSQGEIVALASCKPLDDTSVVAYYSFDQGFADIYNLADTTLIDDSGNGNEGTLTNFALNGPSSNWVVGNVLSDTCEFVPATGLNLDGIDDYIIGTESDFPLGESARTIEGWIKIPGPLVPTNGNSLILAYGSTASNGQASGFGMHNNGKIFYWGHNKDFFGNSELDDDMWHHIAATFDGSQLTMYVDGVVDTVHAIDPGFYNTTSNGQYTIGARILNGNVDFWRYVGKIDEVKLWDYALTQGEIQNGMMCQPKSDATGLVAYYPFDQGLVDLNNQADSLLIDVAGGNDGTLKDFTLDGSVSNWAEGSGVTDTCVTTAIEDVFTTTNAFTLAPNPTRDMLNITLEAKISTNASLQIFDLSGRMIQSQNTQLIGGTETISMDVRNLAAGMYVISIQIDNDRYSEKFIKAD